MNDMEILHQMVQRGDTSRQIAEAFGVCSRTVERWKSREGLVHPISPLVGHRASRERLDAAALMVADGVSHHEITRTLGLTARTLEKHFPGTAWTPMESARFMSEIRRLERLVERNVA